jgi:hypothetical protein
MVSKYYKFVEITQKLVLNFHVNFYRRRKGNASEYLRSHPETSKLRIVSALHTSANTFLIITGPSSWALRVGVDTFIPGRRQSFMAT